MASHTDFEKKIISLNGKVRDIDAAVVNWAKKAAVPDIGIKCDNDHVMCIKCKGVFIDAQEFNDNTAICPHCHTKLTVIPYEQLRKPRLSYSLYFSLTDVLEGIQLIRTFRLSCTMQLRSGEVSFICRELIRHWIAHGGNSAVTAVPVIFGIFVEFGRIRLRSDYRVLYDYYADISKVYPDINLTRKIKGFLGKRFKAEDHIYSRIMEALDNITTER